MKINPKKEGDVLKEGEMWGKTNSDVMARETQRNGVRGEGG